MSQTLTSTPKQDGFSMPPEWAPHKQTWMIWPERTDSWRLGAKPAQAAFVTVIKAIAGFEPVSVGVSAAQYANAYAQLSQANTKFPIRVVEISNNDAWCRDTGPTFVTNGKGEVRGVDWTFNAWGGLNGGLYFPWDRDDQVASKILGIEQLPRYRTEGFVLEGGAIHVDGEGTLLTTAECLLNANRNPHLSREEIEAVLREHLAIEKVLWLEDGIFNDETDGHVDNMACFVKPGEVLLAWTDDKNDPQYARSKAALDYLEASTDAKGRKIKVHKLPVPAPIIAKAEEYASVDQSMAAIPREANARLAGSYINFYLCNGGLILPTFDDPNDQVAAEILQRLFPAHQVVTVPGREILLGGGNIHCITQQQPAG
ncbi:agmatine deiminase [Alishewanella sp. HH-ZS]|uniref:agmatine deiminase n=1 Tax=Alishewanella sp. HH-ZS TaxID=1856684 RepID=UPI0008236E5A|nr:agmatine deiminase [Alishewanella sp. HH-ZS]OCW98486.1 agmatine deiminase [Alishewanella sp. HH-ZS]